VVAEAALKPERHDLVYVTADGREAPVVILQLDVLHDLALLRAGDTAGATTDEVRFLIDDTGGVIKGNILDIWTPTCREARLFGRVKGTAVLVPRPRDAAADTLTTGRLGGAKKSG